MDDSAAAMMDYRLKGCVTNIYVFRVYLPHSAQTAPSNQDTLDELETTIRSLTNKGDCVVVLGDLNAKLGRNIKGYTRNSAATNQAICVVFRH